MVTKPTSTKILGICEPTSTRKGAFFTPKLLGEYFFFNSWIRFFCTICANFLDSGTFVWLIKSLRIACKSLIFFRLLLFSLAEAFGLKVKRIIIDPGHGGKDPGAVGNKQYYEKKIVLKLALMLKKELKKALPKIDILLTRETDKFISLEKRTAFANSKKGDLFISLHCNALENTKVRGIETYYLSLTKNQTALNLAARENSSSLKNISDLQAILNDLINQTKVPESKKLAQIVQKNLIQELKKKYSPKSLGVKKAPFLVLVGSQMPSILVEVGFVTNKNERALLSRSSYLQKISQGITKGVVIYTQSIGKI